VPQRNTKDLAEVPNGFGTSLLTLVQSMDECWRALTSRPLDALLFTLHMQGLDLTGKLESTGPCWVG
jgi:hypothetical protein